MPRFKPRKIKTNARSIASAGIAFVSFRLIFRFMNLPKTEAANIAGIVPIPNITITPMPETALPAAIAPANPIYTNPQGRNPFKNPMIKSEEKLLR